MASNQKGREQRDETVRNLDAFFLPNAQEKEFEVTNEYIFALGSHVIYWGSKDVSLFVAQQVVADAIAGEHDDSRPENPEAVTAAAAAEA